MKLIYLLVAAILPFSANAADEKKLGLIHTSSLGYVQTGGNSSAETVNVTQETKYVWDAELLKWTGNYLSTNTTDPQTKTKSTAAENWATLLRYERSFSDRFGSYVQTGIAGDRIQKIRERKTGGLGLTYITVQTETFAWKNEAGYEYARELFIDAPNLNSTVHPEFHFGRLYTEAKYAHSKALELGFYIEYLVPFADQRQPDVASEEKKNDYRVNFSPYLVSVLSDMFSLKVSYEGRYRNNPVISTNKYLDTTFSTTLIATY